MQSRMRFHVNKLFCIIFGLQDVNKFSSQMFQLKLVPQEKDSSPTYVCFIKRRRSRSRMRGKIVEMV